MILPMIPILHESLNYYINYTSEVGITWFQQLHQHKYIRKQILPIVKKNMTHLSSYRWRHYGDLEAIVEELNATYGKKTLLQIYHEAVADD